METELNNPVIPAEMSMDDILLAAAEQDAKNEEIGPVAPDPVAPTPEPGTEPTKIEPKVEGERKRGPDGKFIKTDAEKEAEANSEAVDASKTATESEYAAKQREKKEKESARLDKTWENVNKQKEEIEQRRIELAQREAALRNPPAPKPQPRKYTSSQLWDAHEDFKKAARTALAGANYDEFSKQEHLADEAFKSANQFYQMEQQEAVQAQQTKWNQGWTGHAAKVMEKMPELADANSPLSLELTELFKSHGPVFYQIPDGFPKAVEIAKLRLDAKDAPTLREKVKAQETEIARLNGLTAPSKGGPAGAPSAKTFEKMNAAEQDAYLMRQAAEHDRRNHISV